MNRSVIPIWVDNEPLPAEDKNQFPIVNGKSQQTLHHAVSADENIAAVAAESSWRAYTLWKRSSLASRRDLLLRFGDILEQQSSDFIQSTVEETSCDEAFARFTFAAGVAKVRETAAYVLSIYGSAVPGLDDPSIHGFVYREPVGPVLLIPPWNTPVMLAVRAIAQAVGAGCSVVLKASELSPKTHFMIAQALSDAKAPPGLLNCMQVQREHAAKVTESLIANKRIRKIEFIGSASTGRAIASTAGRHLKPVILELGGKCPTIVLEDADLAKAAALCITGGMMYHGQLCMSTERLIVHRNVATSFEEELLKAIASKPGVEGSAVNEASAQHAFDVVNDAKTRGHDFIVGDAKFASPTSLVPSIVRCPKGSRMEDEETFGPSLSLYVVGDDTEAIDLANNSDYGYAASIHTRDMDRAIKIARELDYGIVNCNNIQFFTHSNAPAGGMKGTGWGRSNALWGIGNFLVEKSFTYKSP